jgi:hypothetical protein
MCAGKRSRGQNSSLRRCLVTSPLESASFARKDFKLLPFAGTGGYCIRHHAYFTLHAFDRNSFPCGSYLIYPRRSRSQKSHFQLSFDEAVENPGQSRAALPKYVYEYPKRRNPFRPRGRKSRPNHRPRTGSHSRSAQKHANIFDRSPTALVAPRKPLIDLQTGRAELILDWTGFAVATPHCTARPSPAPLRRRASRSPLSGADRTARGPHFPSIAWPASALPHPARRRAVRPVAPRRVQRPRQKRAPLRPRRG